ncbi:MAG: RNA 3'-phosphate cyclase [Rhodothermaceae bacterium]|nr:RNA 3'-phosphate cyclase [Rhodothermaceae bacterium]
MLRTAAVHVPSHAPVDVGAAFLPTLLAASVATGQPVRLDGFRAEAARPGLLRPDLAVVRAAAAACGAEVEGDTVGSTALTFRPGAVRPGEIRVAVGAGGSAVRVIEAVLPALLVADGPSRLVVDGATFSVASLGAEALRQSVAPVLCRMGADVRVTVERVGFAPVGGGRVVVEVRPGALSAIDLETRGPEVGRRVRAVVSGLPVRVARRTLAAAADALAGSSFVVALDAVEASGPGIALVAEVVTTDGVAVQSAIGAPGVASTEVAARLARRVRAVLASDAPVVPEAVPALIVPLALAGGGALRTCGLGTRARLAVEAVRQAGIAVRVLDEPGGAVRVLVG